MDAVPTGDCYRAQAIFLLMCSALSTTDCRLDHQVETQSCRKMWYPSPGHSIRSFATARDTPLCFQDKSRERIGEARSNED